MGVAPVQTGEHAHQSGLRPGQGEVWDVKGTPAEGPLVPGLWRGFLSWNSELEPEP